MNDNYAQEIRYSARKSLAALEDLDLTEKKPYPIHASIEDAKMALERVIQRLDMWKIGILDDSEEV